MIRILQLRLPAGHSQSDLEQAIKKQLKGMPILSWKIHKQSLDARKKKELTYQYVIDIIIEGNEKKLLRSLKNKKLSLVREEQYHFPYKADKKPNVPPVIVGTGPAGLFCGLMLARAGFCPVLIERGQDADKRKEAVGQFWETGKLNPSSNVQFGEGGAGTFSDGKLNTLVKDKFLRSRKVLLELCSHGAPEDILWLAKPHIGTDLLIRVVKNIREEIIRLGGQVFFETQMTDLKILDGRIRSITLQGGTGLFVSHLVLAIGHSARDTFALLYERQVPMEQKSFAVGLRIEHGREQINRAQYGPDWDKYHLPTASYKLTHQASVGRGVYTFCMCPGGYVVNASSEEGMLAVNGMSNHDRMAQNSNAAVVVTVGPGDYKDSHPLSGIRFQQELEKAAYHLCGGRIPVQLYRDFKEDRISEKFGKILPSMKGKYSFGNLREIFPDALSAPIIEGIEAFGGKIEGYNRGDALLSGVESRTSSPVRIPRDENFESSIKGLYPCGEGAGYAGGITSAAIDGIKVAEAVARSYLSETEK